MIETGRTYTEQLNIRLRTEEKNALESRAQQAGKPLAEWGREVLVGSVGLRPEERRQLMTLVIGSEINRLTIVSAQNGEDVAGDLIRERIERQAKASAEAILERWLNFPAPQKGAA